MGVLEKIQSEHRRWTENNFGDQPYWHPLLGVVEEVGELAHAELKGEQGIRDCAHRDELACDAVGDIMIYLIGYCTTKGFNIEKILTETWSETVKKRNWKKNKEDGSE